MRTLVLCLLFSSTAWGQFAPYFPGQSPNDGLIRSGVSPVDALPRSFAVYGDSIALGLCSTTAPHLALSALLPGYLAANHAQSGTTTSEIATHYFATRDTACDGTLCGTYLFEGGVNNVKNGSGTPSSMLSDMLSAVDDARSRGRRVVWTNIAPFKGCGFCGDPATGWTLAKSYNTLWAAACAARPDITCVDVGAGTAWEEPSTDGYLKTAWSCDGIHWLQGGTEAWAQAASAANAE